MQLDAGLNIKLFKRHISCMSILLSFISGNFHATFPCNFIRQLSCNFIRQLSCNFSMQLYQATSMQLFQATLSGNFHATFPGNFHATFRLSPFCCMQDNYYVQNSGCGWVGEFNRLARCKLLLTVTEGAYKHSLLLATKRILPNCGPLRTSRECHHGGRLFPDSSPIVVLAFTFPRDRA